MFVWPVYLKEPGVTRHSDNLTPVTEEVIINDANFNAQIRPVPGVWTQLARAQAMKSRKVAKEG